MRIVDRMTRLETVAGAARDRRRRMEFDAAAFSSEIDRLVARHGGSPSTLADFHASIRRSGSAFLITVFS